MKTRFLITLLLFNFCFNVYSQEWMNKLDPQLSSFYQYKFEPIPIQDLSIGQDHFEITIPPNSNLFNLSDYDPILRVIIKSNTVSINELNSLGVKIQSKVGDIMTAHIPLSVLKEVAQNVNIQSIQIGMPVEPHLDISAPKVRAPEGRSTFGVTGNGVIVGLIDSGIDITHEDFKNPDGTTRILYIWDQKDILGPNPQDFSYGTEWNSTSINNGSCRQKDLQGHGTFVSGIATGNGRATGNGQPANTYVGIAPEADIIFVKLDYSNFANVIDALLWIAHKSTIVDKPWVANLSLGTNFGPHDGTSLFEQAIYGVTNQIDLGKGRIIVNSAGNSGFDLSNPNSIDADRIHSSGNGNSASVFTVNSSSLSQTEKMWMQIWYPQGTNYSISVTAPGGRVYGPFAPGTGTGLPNQGTIYFTDTDGMVSIHNENWNGSSSHNLYYPNTPDKMIEIYLGDYTISNNHYPLRNGDWTITLTNGSGRWDAYIPTSSGLDGGSYFNINNFENARIISEPGNSFNTITVGSFNSKNSWTDVNGNFVSKSNYPIDLISHFSSPGPTRDGRSKPDIFAPGAWVSSSKSDDGILSISNNQISRDGKHFNSTGTSASAPHVTGAVALLLQQNPNYTFADIKNILIQSNTPEGYLDVYSALAINGVPVGIEDDITIESGPSLIVPGQNVTYTARFIDYPPSSWMFNWDWEIVLFHEGGSYIYASASTTGMNYTQWTTTTSTSLPTNFNWYRNQDGCISGKVRVSGIDSDFIYHLTEMNVGVALLPNKPIIYNKYSGQESITISFLSNGASNYRIYYDIDSGHPYNGSGAIEGNSPINIGNLNTFTLTGLNQGVNYYINIKAFNSAGESLYADEIVIKPATMNGLLQADEIWQGNITLLGTITVPVGITLSILQNANVMFPSGASLIVNGTLNTHGSILSGVNNGTWSSIIFDGASASKLENTQIKKANEIRCLNNSNVEIKYSLLDNCYQGIYIYNSAPQIIGNEIIDPYGNGIYGEANGKSPLIQNNKIKKVSRNLYNAQGIYLLNYTNPLITGNDIQGFYYGIYFAGGGSGNCTNASFVTPLRNNRLVGNRIGMTVAWGSTLTAGAPAGPPTGSCNSIWGNTNYDATAYQSGQIFARENWWGSDGVQVYYYSNGYIYTGSLASDPWENIPLKNEKDPNNLRSIENAEISSSYMPKIESYQEKGPNFEDLITGINLEKEDRILESVIHYKRMITNNSFPKFALSRLIGLRKKFSIQNIHSYLTELANSNYLYKTTVQNLLASELIDEGKFTAAVTLYDRIIDVDGNEYNGINARFGKFFTALHNIKDWTLADQLLQDIRSLALIDEDLLMRLEIAENQLNNTGFESSQLEKRSHRQTEELVNDYSLSQNYPNPFNPSTVIKYSLKNDGRVTLKIFNTLGEEIQTLVNEIKSSGSYSAEFDASQLPSGVYIYRINSGDFVSSKKMMLIK